MTVKTYLIGIFLDHLNAEGCPETYIVSEPEHVYNTDTVAVKLTFVHTKNTPDPIIAKKPLTFAVGPHLRSVQTNIPLLKVKP